MKDNNIGGKNGQEKGREPPPQAKKETLQKAGKINGVKKVHLAGAYNLRLSQRVMYSHYKDMMKIEIDVVQVARLGNPIRGNV